jgi:ribosomal protein S24E
MGGNSEAIVMAQPMSFGESQESAAESSAYDVEAQLATAEQRYALARERSRKARDECHALEHEHDTRAELIRQARARHEAAEAKCKRLRQLIEELEERLS